MNAREVITRLLAAVPGFLMLVNGVGFVFDPVTAAEGLGMELQEGMARSTQIGDVGALFLGTAAFIILGAWRASWQWLAAGAFLLILVAVMRLVGWAFHGAELAVVFITVECVLAAWLTGFGWWFARSR